MIMNSERKLWLQNVGSRLRMHTTSMTRGLYHRAKESGNDCAIITLLSSCLSESEISYAGPERDHFRSPTTEVNIITQLGSRVHRFANITSTHFYQTKHESPESEKSTITDFCKVHRSLGLISEGFRALKVFPNAVRWVQAFPQCTGLHCSVLFPFSRNIIPCICSARHFSILNDGVFMLASTSSAASETSLIVYDYASILILSVVNIIPCLWSPGGFYALLFLSCNPRLHQSKAYTPCVLRSGAKHTIVCTDKAC